MAERIIRAAIMLDGRVWHLPPPKRHHDVISKIFLTGGEPGRGVQGFLTSDERFVDRVEGLRIASDAGQIVEKHGNPDELFSEDMW
jgi:hypothetical protein